MSPTGRVAAAALALAFAQACKQGPSSTAAPPAGARAVGAGSPGAGGGAAAPGSGAPRVPVGVKTPFEPLDRASAKTFAAAQAALRAKKYGPARDLFHEVVTAHPDHLAARHQELRSALLADPAADVRELWRDLLARDFIGYASRLDTAPELAALRRSPRWPELTQIRAELEAAYAQGFERGFFFVARSHPAKPQLYDEKARPVLELFQEAYFYDLATGRVRRLTETGGRVFGILPDRKGKRLLLLLVEALADHDVDTGHSFSIFKAGLVSLETLEQKAPIAFPAGAPAAEVSLCVSDKGTPLWTTTARYTVDPAQKKLVETPEVCPATSGVTVTPDRGQRARPAAAGVIVDVGRRAFTIDGTQEVRRKGSIARESIGWSPAKTRLVFADAYSPCDLEQSSPDESWPLTARSALLLWDVATKKATPVAEAFSFFEWEWLDDDHLAHEAGSKTSPRVAVYEISSGTDTVVDTRAGAGLVAVPTSACTIRTAEDAEGGE
ncbi:MAG TPA: hypothetical protein VIF57_08935 [Polyangia bacterium]